MQEQVDEIEVELDRSNHVVVAAILVDQSRGVVQDKAAENHDTHRMVEECDERRPCHDGNKAEQNVAPQSADQEATHETEVCLRVVCIARQGAEHHGSNSQRLRNFDSMPRLVLECADYTDHAPHNSDEQEQVLVVIRVLVFLHHQCTEGSDHRHEQQDLEENWMCSDKGNARESERGPEHEDAAYSGGPQELDGKNRIDLLDEIIPHIRWHLPIEHLK